uniref:Macrofage activating glycoprotein n=1 Tax=Hemileia vastatrix TaxID=203904 RepID=T1UN03_9BASI|nr:macrofage activating glycoprotein [Hemileia vastatrix]
MTGLAAWLSVWLSAVGVLHTAAQITQDTGGDIPLASKHFTWPALPYQADTGNGPRGQQQGLIRTPDYIQVVGMIDQTKLNLPADDSGGEEDPHGADSRGNPLGSLLYSSAFNKPGGPEYTQVIEWSYFVGGGIFCFKACDPAGPNAASLCQHIYDRVGCVYNAPSNYSAINGTFQFCKGDNQLPVGVYVENGVTKTWNQPPEALGPINSDCATFTSDALYADLPTPVGAVATATSTGKPGNNQTGTYSNNGVPVPTQEPKKSNAVEGLYVAAPITGLGILVGLGSFLFGVVGTL